MKPPFERANPKSMGDLSFLSTAAMERGLDGGEDRFAAYFFAIYQCSPDDPDAGVNECREQLRREFPTKVLSVGKRFILTGEAAYKALGGYYYALSLGAQNDNRRKYAKERLEEITEVHRNSQSLLIRMDLTEGQLAQDFRLEFLTCIAILNGQIVHSSETSGAGERRWPWQR